MFRFASRTSNSFWLIFAIDFLPRFRHFVSRIDARSFFACIVMSQIFCSSRRLK